MCFFFVNNGQITIVVVTSFHYLSPLMPVHCRLTGIVTYKCMQEVWLCSCCVEMEERNSQFARFFQPALELRMIMKHDRVTYMTVLLAQPGRTEHIIIGFAIFRKVHTTDQISCTCRCPRFANLLHAAMHSIAEIRER